MKKAKSIEEQIELLEQRGLIIPNKDKAKEVLMDIGFYRLGFYLFPFETTFPEQKNRTHTLMTNTTFEDVLSLYYFDSDLRQILTVYLNRIEINIRTYITYIASIKYQNSPFWFTDKKYVQQTYLDAFDKQVYQRIKGNPVITRHHQKYINDIYAPAWKTMEFMTIGNIVSLFRNLKDTDLQQQIVDHYKCGTVKRFQNYLETIRVIRNSCAHGACVYNIKLPLGVKAGPAGRFSGDDRHTICSIISVIKYIVGVISHNRQGDMEAQIRELLNTKRSGQVTNIIDKCTKIPL